MRSYAWVMSLALVAGCSDSGAPPLVITERPADDVGYQPGVADTVISGDKEFVVEGQLPADCVKVGAECVAIAQLKAERCGSADAQADIVLVEGQVVEVICYPPLSDGQPLEQAGISTDGQVEIPQNANGTVITFPPATDGKETDGAVSLQGERMAVIGNGVDQTTIGGNLVVASNNAKIRGLTVKGNLVIEKNANNVSIAFVRVLGNVVIDGNDALVVRADVYGNLHLTGNNGSLRALYIAGQLQVDGGGSECTDLYAFADANEDYTLAPTEVGAALSCPN